VATALRFSSKFFLNALKSSAMLLKRRKQLSQKARLVWFAKIIADEKIE